MPAARAQSGSGGSPSEVAKNAALEALAAHRPLTREEARVLAAIGLTPGDRPGHTGRPWDEADRLLVRRLRLVRGWSALAIATFLHRPVAEVLEMLGPIAGGRRRRRPPAGSPA